MKEPSASISLRISRELWIKIHDLIDGRNCPDFSHVARSLIEAGLWLHENKSDLEDPEKTQKVIADYNSKTNERNLFSWVGQLSDIQIQGMQSALELEREKRVN